MKGIMMGEEYQVRLSPLCRKAEFDGECVNILIYLDDEGRWALAVMDENENTAVWDDSFDSDQEALDEAIKVIEEEGIQSFIDPQGETIH
jgi:hypothetical protein